MRNSLFEVECNACNGSIQALRHPQDDYAMNWVVSPEENPWHTISNNWGLGAFRYGDADTGTMVFAHWESLESFQADDLSCTAEYATGPVQVRVERAFRNENCLTERYHVKNRSGRELRLYNLSVNTPFNDNYPNSAICVTKRCNAHIWCGGATAYVNAIRMGGASPHLGWVLTDGALSGYAINNRGLYRTSSNARGDIAVLAGDMTLPVDGEYVLGWRLFWHQGWENFEAAIREHAPFVQLEAEEYTVHNRSPLTITVKGRIPPEQLECRAGAILLTPEPEPDLIRYRFRPTETGEVIVKVTDKSNATFARVLVIDDPDKIIDNRVNFIIDHQQERDPENELYGAFLVYDNETQTRICGKGDLNEGRERVGMGVLLAQWLQRQPSPKYREALEVYCNFVRKRLQAPTYEVLNGVEDEHCRLYNYPWVAMLYLESCRAIASKQYALDMYRTLEAFYRNGHAFYAIDIPVIESLQVLENFGLNRERDRLLKHFVEQAGFIQDHGVNYPPHEVNYEQTIVGPAAGFLLEMCLATGDPEYLEAARPHLACLEAFNGRQPDYHLHEIAIRHWDGWWFGKRPLWGDTFPHYWSTVTAVVFWRYWQVTGDRDYLGRAKKIAMNNLCLFTPDGQASCAYLYPTLVDGQPAGYYDPYANDQDWALVHYLKMATDI